MPKDTNKDKDAQLTALQAAFGTDVFPSLDDVATFVIDRYWTAHFGAALPGGWALNEDLTTDDMVSYFDALNEDEAAKGRSVWHDRVRTIRAANAAGWIAAPVGLSNEAIGKLKPYVTTQVKNALDAHYIKLTMPAPNSSGPSPTT